MTSVRRNPPRAFGPLLGQARIRRCTPDAAPRPGPAGAEARRRSTYVGQGVSALARALRDNLLHAARDAPDEDIAGGTRATRFDGLAAPFGQRPGRSSFVRSAGSAGHMRRDPYASGALRPASREPEEILASADGTEPVGPGFGPTSLWRPGLSENDAEPVDR
ncbi:hypothetical protein GCM10015535_33160 [Streptomyces gelaticus]|uniref:Uncharacterized protein n=1 Tax=Streptomyces gelaticus TaxID=285446 RepID=A0ABQ2VZ28_9ACTN|nr:hypothetical protein GCM10015535_33160 [Streptomyces gelaticus]